MKRILKILIGTWILISIFTIQVHSIDYGKFDPKLKLILDEPQLNRLFYFQHYGVAKTTTQIIEKEITL